MAQHILTEGNDVYVSNLVPTGSETANSILGLGGNDTITGNGYVDFIHGGTGNDTLNGMGGDDVLNGQEGDDVLDGGSGDDLVLGGDGNDVLYGGTGTDRLWGGTGNDHYVYNKSDGGIDTINDDKYPTGQTGGGGGTADYFFFGEVAAADIRFYRSGDDMWVTDVADVADGVMDTGVILEDFFLGGNNVIERVYGGDNYYYDMTQFLP